MMKKMIVLFLILCATVFASSISRESMGNSIVVYGANTAYIQQHHEAFLDQGKSQLSYTGITPNVIPESICLELGADAHVLSERFVNNAPTLNQLLQVSIGKKVGYKKRQVTLLSTSGLNALIQDAQGKILSVRATALRFSHLPSLFTLKPSFVWEINATKKSKREISLDYLVRNISWRGDYFLHVRDDKVDLVGWIAIKNGTNVSYKNSTLFVVAGAVSMGALPRTNMLYARASRAPQIATASLQGYHIYRLPMKIDLAADATTRVKFLEKKGLQYRKKYIAILQDPSKLQHKVIAPVAQYITFENKDFVLPAGDVRVYAAYQNRSIFVGQSPLAHRSKGEQITLNIGKAFDLHVSQNVTERLLSKDRVDTQVLYKVQNSSDKAKNILLKVPFIKGKNSHLTTDKKYTLQDGYAVFAIRVKAASVQSFQVRFQKKN